MNCYRNTSHRSHVPGTVEDLRCMEEHRKHVRETNRLVFTVIAVIVTVTSPVRSPSAGR